MQRLDEALMIAEFALSCMPSVPADNPIFLPRPLISIHLFEEFACSRLLRGAKNLFRRTVFNDDAAVSEVNFVRYFARERHFMSD